jgi:hypothetical protein
LDRRARSASFDHHTLIYGKPTFIRNVAKFRPEAPAPPELSQGVILTADAVDYITSNPHADQLSYTFAELYAQAQNL